MDKEAQLLYVMEATGVYYESLAYHLTKLKLPVSFLRWAVCKSFKNGRHLHPSIGSCGLYAVFILK